VGCHEEQMKVWEAEEAEIDRQVEPAYCGVAFPAGGSGSVTPRHWATICSKNYLAIIVLFITLFGLYVGSATNPELVWRALHRMARQTARQRNFRGKTRHQPARGSTTAQQSGSSQKTRRGHTTPFSVRTTGGESESRPRRIDPAKEEKNERETE
jgi:hypothetical protein